ncbi:MAG: hypothetical protein IPP42_02180 [Saprospiraceae bacterium]|nr:hypothetical protein [Saprospiraceae bacterium]
MKTQQHDKWPITTRRYVGYIDIMGFKDMVARSTHEEIYEMMKRMDNKIKRSASIDWGQYNSKLITTTTYSDSIIIYQKIAVTHQLIRSFVPFHHLRKIYLEECIPHKGVFAFGEMTLDEENSIFFGQPLIDAYLMQDELAFYGIVGHASAEKEFSTHAMDDYPFIEKYLCPFKNGKSMHLTIFPMSLYPYKDQSENRKNAVTKIYKSINSLRFKTSGHLRKYIDNTEEYLETISKG